MVEGGVLIDVAPKTHPAWRREEQQEPLRSQDIRIAIVIPVFNHAGTLREVVRRALDVHDEVIVVDDGSTDQGVDAIRDLSMRTVQHPVNYGKGAAILTGAREAHRIKMTHIVTMDADGQHDPADFERFVPLLMREPDSIVLGNRLFEGTHAGAGSRFGRTFSNFWVRLQTGEALKDTQSGFRAYPIAVFERLQLRQRRFAFEVEVLVKAAWAGMPIREVDISVHYPPAEDRISHFNALLDNARISWLNTKLTTRAIAPLPHRKIFHPKREGERITLLHPIRSLRALVKEDASIRRLAAAGALGVLLGALPLIGFHTVSILFVASFFRLNKIVAISTSQLCMPPFVPALCIEVGHFLRHGRFLTEISLETIGYQGLERIYEWLIGSLLVGPAMGILLGGAIYLSASLIRRGLK
jgi:glycosyltransferase involved in cell wall biosynthesis